MTDPSITPEPSAAMRRDYEGLKERLLNESSCDNFDHLQLAMIDAATFMDSAIQLRDFIRAGVLATAWDEGHDDAVRRIVQVVEDNKAEGTAGYFIRKVPADLNHQRYWYAVAAVSALITGGWSITRSPATTKGN